EARTGSKDRDGLDFDSGAAGLGDCGRAAVLPLIVRSLTASHLSATLIGLEDPLLSYPNILFCLEHQYVRVPPGDHLCAHLRLVQARPDTSADRHHPLRPPIDDAIVAEAGRPWYGFALAFRVVGRQ